MKLCFASVVASVVFVVVLSTVSGCARRESETEGSKAKRIGTYDPEAVWRAFPDSRIYNEWMVTLDQEIAEAESYGESFQVEWLEHARKKRDKELKDPESGVRIAKRVVEMIEGDLEPIREDRFVSTILPEGDVRTRCGGCQRVDVTMNVVDVLVPTEEHRREAMDTWREDHSGTGLVARLDRNDWLPHPPAE